MEFNQDFFNWIDKYKDVAPYKLRLKFLSSKDYPDWLTIAIDHIEVLKKARKKFVKDNISFLPELLFPSVAVEQSSSIYTSLCHREIIESKLKERPLNILDLTLGLGIDARCFADHGHNVTGLDKDQLKCLIGNFNYRNYKNIRIINEDSVKYVKKLKDEYHAIFIDPSRRDISGRRIYSIKDCEPDISEILEYLQGINSMLFIKLSPMLDIDQLFKELKGIIGLNIIGAKSECKEIVAELNLKETVVLDKKEVPITVFYDGYKPFVFNYSEEENLKHEVKYDIPIPGKFVYLPYAPFVKARAFNSLATRFGMYMIVEKSAIYLSEKENKDFPGKAYYIEEAYEWKASNIKSISRLKIRGEITARNFPLNESEIQQKLNIRPGDSEYIIATSNKEGRRFILRCKRT